MQQLEKVIQYSLTWEEDYEIPYDVGSTVDIRTYLISANYLGGGGRKETSSVSNVGRHVRIYKTMRQKP